MVNRQQMGLVLAFVSMAVALQAQAPARPPEPRINALVVSGGCCHDYTTQAKLLMEIVGDALPVDWTVVNQGGASRDAKIPLYANPNWIDGFDIVVHNECFGFVDDADYIRRIVDAHRRSGVPAVVTHCSMHSYRNATIDDWRELVGVTSRRHTAAHPISIAWTDTMHPIAQGMDGAWTTPVDELYVIEKAWPDVHVLATAASPEEGHAVYPVVWTNQPGSVRVFGTTLGHDDSWNDPTFQRLIARGFAWVIGREGAADRAAR